MTPWKNPLFRLGLVCTVASLALGLGLLGYSFYLSARDGDRTARINGNGLSQPVEIVYREVEVIASDYHGPQAPVRVTGPTGQAVPVKVSESDATRRIGGKESKELATFVADTPGTYRVAVSLQPATTTVVVSPVVSNAFGFSAFGSGTLCCVLVPIGLLSLLFG